MVRNFVNGCYYRDTATDRIFLIRELSSATTCFAVQCFCKSRRDCLVLVLSEFKKLNIEFYALTFKEAFERYWRENRARLILENKAEIRGVKLPYNFF